MTSPEVFHLAVTPYLRLPLSLRDVEDLIHARGIEVSYETVRYWRRRSGPTIAAELRARWGEGQRSVSRRLRHLHEVFVRISGVQHDLRRAVDHEGEVLEALSPTDGTRRLRPVSSRS